MRSAVCVDGPFPEQDRHGDEIPVWTITMIDSNDNETLVCRHYTYQSAVDDALALCKQHKAEYINEAMQV